MDLTSALAKLGRSILVAIGLATVVQVGFEEPVLRASPGGTAIVGTRLSGAITEEMIPLVERSVPVRLVLSAESYYRSGTRESVVRTQSLSYRSLDRRFVVRKDAVETEYASIEGAIAEVERFEVALPGELPESMVFGARLEMPTIPDAQAIRDLWRGRDPTLVFATGPR